MAATIANHLTENLKIFENNGDTARTGAMHVIIDSGTLTGSGSGSNANSASAAATTNVAASASNVTLLAANTSRKSASIYNDADKILYVKFGATASTSSFKIAIAAAGYFEFPSPIYTGQVDGIWATAPTGSARISEES